MVELPLEKPGRYEISVRGTVNDVSCAAGTIAFAKTMLRMFLEGLAAPDLDESLRVVTLG